jgi:hypothetical protein
MVTLFLMIKRPFGLRLGYIAGIGAAASLLLGTVSLGQAVANLQIIEEWVVDAKALVQSLS